MHGRHLLKTDSRTQSIIALSSAEAELFATVGAASEALRLSAMCTEIGALLELRLYVDASVAIGIAQRKGLGKVGHLDFETSMNQDVVRKKQIYLEKVAGTDNPARIVTKHVDLLLPNKMMVNIGLEHRGGRATSAPKLPKDGTDRTETDVPRISLLVDDMNRQLELIHEKKSKDIVM